jgi:hypothetical protein
MAYEQQPGNGVLFSNNDKKSPKAPDWNGNFMADRAYQPGEIIKLSGWNKRSNYGELISIAVNNYVPGQPPKQAKEVTYGNDDVPF